MFVLNKLSESESESESWIKGFTRNYNNRAS